MTLQKVPVQNVDRQTFDVELGAQLVRFGVWWQPSDRSWYMSLEFQDGTRVFSGRRLVAGQNMLSGVVSDFSGSIVVHGLTAEIGREAWDVTHEVIFDSEG